MKMMAIIPARAGSEGIKDKNVRDFFGKPLISWAIECAQRSGLFEKIIVSTDSNSIQSIAKQYGCEAPFVRPAELSHSKAGIEGVLKHAYEWVKDNQNFDPQYIALILPTSPLRTVNHLKLVSEVAMQSNADCVFTVNEPPANHTPYWTLFEDDNGDLTFLNDTPLKNGYTRRQDFPRKCYVKNDLVYLFRPSNLYQSPSNIYGDKQKKVLTHPLYDGDINNQEDWDLVASMFPITKKLAEKGIY